MIKSQFFRGAGLLVGLLGLAATGFGCLAYYKTLQTVEGPGGFAACVPAGLVMMALGACANRYGAFTDPS